MSCAGAIGTCRLVFFVRRPLATEPAAAGEAVLARVDGVAGGDGGDRGIGVAGASTGLVFFCASRSAPVGRSVADASTCPLLGTATAARRGAGVIRYAVATFKFGQPSRWGECRPLQAAQ